MLANQNVYQLLLLLLLLLLLALAHSRVGLWSWRGKLITEWHSGTRANLSYINRMLKFYFVHARQAAPIWPEAHPCCSSRRRRLAPLRGANRIRPPPRSGANLRRAHSGPAALITGAGSGPICEGAGLIGRGACAERATDWGRAGSWQPLKINERAQIWRRPKGVPPIGSGHSIGSCGGGGRCRAPVQGVLA